ncbi:hypothetical protein EUTSA_v10009564mg [Eutrema salsugineum]|uniref:Pectinesterase inhibitor domain-containing protein n=1 Tax=Eutrema salsugineum TaxID=72664 RepID=V4L067_EUTSA|nr:hypothetical protein EUTSA_v10009564mg [Eutrema salsugineum]
MVAYLKNNFLLVFIIAILFFVVPSYARFSMMVLNSTPNIGKLDFSGLTKVLINYQFRNISKTLKQIKLLEGNTTDWQTVNLCERLYEGALHGNERSLEALAAKDYNSLNVRITGVSTDIGTCMDEVATMKQIPQFLIMDSTVIDNIGFIILKILECYIRKEKIRC